MDDNRMGRRGSARQPRPPATTRLLCLPLFQSISTICNWRPAARRQGAPIFFALSRIFESRVGAGIGAGELESLFGRGGAGASDAVACRRRDRGHGHRG